MAAMGLRALEHPDTAAIWDDIEQAWERYWRI
jgi:hypothetical protein